MIIAKIQKPFTTSLTFLPNMGFVWVSKVAIPSYTQPIDYDTSFFDFSDVNQTPLNITTVYIDDIEYGSQPTEALCRSNEKSYYFDITTQELFIHINHEKRMDSSEFQANQIVGYCDEKVFYDENDVKYLPLIESGFTLSDSVDRFIFSRLSLISNTLKVDNRDGDFDFMIENIIAGSDISIYYISSEDLEDGKNSLTPIYTGYIISTTMNTNSLSIKLEDKRGQLNQKIPSVLFDIDTYPNIEDDLLGEVIPEGYGDLNNAPAYCTNGSLTSGDVTYKYATDGTTLTTVQVLEDDIWTTVTPSSEDAETCEFTLATADGRNSSGAALEARVVCRLRDMDNPADILADLINRILYYPFITDYYNLNEWSDERALLEDIYFYMPERQEFFKYIEALQNASTIPFRFNVDASGKYEIRVNDITRQVTTELSYLDNLDDNKSIVTDFTEYATDVQILYNQDLVSESFSTVFSDTYKEETYDKYRLYKELEFESNLKTEALAEIKAEAALKEYKLARALYKLKLDCVKCVNLLDVIIFDNSVYLDGELVREYAGTKKIKVSKIVIDFANETTIIEGYDISDITSKGTETYSQGYINNYHINGFTLNSRTHTYIPTPG